MTEQEKQLLLVDLSARLPYGVCVRHQDYIVDEKGEETGELVYYDGYLCNINTCDDITTSMIIMSGEDEGYEHHNFLEETKPYLRSMSSMTEEELYEWTHTWIMDNTIEKYDWLNKKHLDYRGLIPMELALEAPEDIYK